MEETRLRELARDPEKLEVFVASGGIIESPREGLGAWSGWGLA